MKGPVITVAIAAYNAEKYISACIDCLLKQSFSDFELLIADDGSADGTRDICLSYAEKDSRVKPLFFEHSGVAVMRNELVAAAKGEYFAFVDSDDLVHEKYLEALYSAITSSGADLSVCSFAVFSEEKPADIPLNIPCDYRMLTVREAVGQLTDFSDDEYIRYVFPMCKLYRAEIIKGIKYPTGKFFEDEAVSGELVYRCKRGVAAINERLYYYYRNMNGITKSAVSTKQFDAFFAIEQNISFFSDKPEYKEAYAAFIKEGYNVYRGIWIKFVGAKADKSFMARLKKEFAAYFRKYKRTVKPSYEKFYTFYCFMHPALKPYYFLRYTLERNSLRGSVKKLFKRKQKNAGKIKD